ncbi:MAG: hypothetical protein P8127_11240, partial [Acidobacteriota bacterium]
MKTRNASRLVTPFMLLVLGAFPLAASEDLTGTRPGADGQPLTVHGALFLLDVSKIDGAEQSFTADVFMMLRWRDERLVEET